MPEVTHPPMPRRTLLIGSLALAFTDIMSKYVIFWALGQPNVMSHHGKTVIPGFFYLTTRYNTGFSWSSFSGTPWLLSAFINMLILGAVIYFFFFTQRLPVNRWTMACGMLIMGGAFGNLYDRIFHEGVRDFLDVIIPVINYSYPVFNLADVFIVVGVIIAIMEPYLAGRSREKEAPNG